MPDQAPQTTQGDDELGYNLHQLYKSRIAGHITVAEYVQRQSDLFQAELSKQREQARQEVLDELEAELPKYNGWKLHDSHKKWSKATFWEGAIVEVKGLINAKRKKGDHGPGE